MFHNVPGVIVSIMRCVLFLNACVIVHLHWRCGDGRIGGRRASCLWPWLLPRRRRRSLSYSRTVSFSIPFSAFFKLALLALHKFPGLFPLFIYNVLLFVGALPREVVLQRAISSGSARKGARGQTYNPGLGSGCKISRQRELLYVSVSHLCRDLLACQPPEALSSSHIRLPRLGRFAL